MGMDCLPLFVVLFLVSVGSSQDVELHPITVDYTYKETTEPIRILSTTADSQQLASPNQQLSSVQRAITWLITQRDNDWGWRNDTSKVLTALQLANQEVVSLGLMANPLEMQMSSKQMEVEIVVLLWRHHEIPVLSTKLAQYCLSLSALCFDPRQFHEHDLIGTLQHHEPVHDLEFAFVTLAACSARAHVRKKQIRRLLDIANTAKDHNIDTVAMTILALRCIVKDHRHRNLQHSLRRPSINLARQQQSEGGFGNIYNTALTMQALQDLNEINNHWNRSLAKMYIESRQDPDGAFTDPNLTAEVILALSERGLGHIRNLDCGKYDVDFDNHVEIDGLTKSLSNHGNESEIRNVTVTYTLWVGSNVTENLTLSITAPRNTSFYNVMQMAMDMDPRFSFEAFEWPNGHYVHTLSGYKEEPMGYHYWLLYRLPEIPDPLSPPANQLVAPVGVDDLLIEEGDHYLFWYKKL